MQQNDNAIVIVNGFTGSFFDNVTRKGALRKKFLYGFYRDLHAVEAFCELTLNENRWNSTNIQVYICGIPTFPMDVVLRLLNRKIKRMTEQFPHVIYVQSTGNHLVHKNEKIYLDVHYDPKGYQRLEQKIVQAILNNFKSTETTIRLDRDLSTQNNSAELAGKQPAKKCGGIINIKALRAQAPHNYRLLN